MTTTAHNYKQMDAKFPGTCKFCGQKIQAGEPILYYFQERKIAHDVSSKCRAYKEEIAKTAAFTNLILQKEQEARQARVEAANKAPAARVLQDGYYTVVFDFGGQRRHKTFRIYTGKKGKFGEGRQMVAVFLGTENDNDNDYQTFAFLSGGTLAVWKRFALYEHEIAAINYMLEGEHAEDAGILYALESNRCRRCGRLLTNPASITNTYGPECGKKI